MAPAPAFAAALCFAAPTSALALSACLRLARGRLAPLGRASHQGWRHLTPNATAAASSTLATTGSSGGRTRGRRAITEIRSGAILASKCVAAFCTLALPPRSSATRCSMAPARAMATRLASVSARLYSAASAISCAIALSLSLRISATRGSIAPARAMATRFSVLSEEILASAEAAPTAAFALPSRSSATKGSISPARASMTIWSELWQIVASAVWAYSGAFWRPVLSWRTPINDTRAFMPPTVAISSRLSVFPARWAIAEAAASCALALPSRTSATRGSMAPARAIPTRLAALAEARLFRATAAFSCTSMLPLRTIATRGSMSPAVRAPKAPRPAPTSRARSMRGLYPCRRGLAWIVTEGCGGRATQKVPAMPLPQVWRSRGAPTF
eukprot:scaffold130717_cov66-Phaeocystis_antarctica.AAC.3